MAFERPSLLFPLVFEPEPLAGLEIWHRPPPVPVFDVALHLGDWSPADELTDREIGRLWPLAELLARIIVRWNYEDRGRPVPVSEFLALDAMFVLRVTATWARVLVGLPQSVPDVVALPDIDDGDGFDESQIPMEELA